MGATKLLREWTSFSSNMMHFVFKFGDFIEQILFSIFRLLFQYFSKAICGNDIRSDKVFKETNVDPVVLVNA